MVRLGDWVEGPVGGPKLWIDSSTDGGGKRARQEWSADASADSNAYGMGWVETAVSWGRRFRLAWWFVRVRASWQGCGRKSFQKGRGLYFLRKWGGTVDGSAASNIVDPLLKTIRSSAVGDRDGSVTTPYAARALETDSKYCTL